MKVTINSTDYTALKDIEFAPETDITGDRTPINGIKVNVITTDDIDVGQYMKVYDDAGGLWAKYWIVYAEHIDKNTVRIDGQSVLKLLERDIKDPVMYSAEPITNVLDDIFSTIGTTEYTLDSTLSAQTITGFCPEQSAKTRLQWVCFAIGAYVKDSFVDKIQIKAVGADSTLIPLDKTFYKPAVTYGDYVTAVSITAYSFTQGTPASTDEWVSDGTNTYIVTKQKYSLSNPDAPASALVNVVSFEDIMLINSNNVSQMLTFFSTYYFKRMSVEMDIVNNREFQPGDSVMVYTDIDSMCAGYIDSASFTFGLQARSHIKLSPVETVETAVITVNYVYQGSTVYPLPSGQELPEMMLDSKEYTLPVGYEYTLENMAYETEANGVRYAFVPTSPTITGTVPSENVTITVNYVPALVHSNHVLQIISVEEINAAEGVVNIS